MKEQQTITDILHEAEELNIILRAEYQRGYVNGHRDGYNEARELFNTDNETQEEN